MMALCVPFNIYYSDEKSNTTAMMTLPPPPHLNTSPDAVPTPAHPESSHHGGG